MVVLLVVLGVLVLIVALGLIGSALGGGDDQSAGDQQGRAVTAQVVADRLAEQWPLPNPRDNTASCRDAGCLGLVTTDAVSVYEFGDAGAAAKWADGLKGSDVRAVDRFALSWVGTEQDQTSAEARDAMVAAVAEML